MSITASMPARCSPRRVAGMPPPPTGDDDRARGEQRADRVELDDLERLRRGHDAPPAAARVVDDLPAAVALELAGLLPRRRTARSASSAPRTRVVLGDEHVREQADDGPAGDRLELALDQRADLGLRLRDREVERQRRRLVGRPLLAEQLVPDLRAVPVRDDELARPSSGRSAAQASRRFARCSAAVPRSPGRISAFPPSATTASNERFVADQAVLARTSASVGSPTSSSWYVTRSAGTSKSISRRRSIGVPISTSSASEALDRRLEVVHLLAPVAHRGQERADVRVVLEGLRDRADRERRAGRPARPRRSPSRRGRRRRRSSRRGSASARPRSRARACRAISAASPSTWNGEAASTIFAPRVVRRGSTRARRRCLPGVALSILLTTQTSAMRRFVSPGW